jgi:hypothetical protein
MTSPSPAGSSDLDWTRGAPAAPPTPSTGSRPRRVGSAVALVVAGVIAGGLGATALHGSSAATTSTNQLGTPGQAGARGAGQAPGSVGGAGAPPGGVTGIGVGVAAP